VEYEIPGCFLQALRNSKLVFSSSVNVSRLLQKDMLARFESLDRIFTCQ